MHKCRDEELPTLKLYKEYRPTSWDTRGLGPQELQTMYVAPCGINRDSETLDRSNWAVQLQDLQSIDPSCEIHRFGHWACGWFEILLVPGDSPAIMRARQIAYALTQYPALNEDHWTALEHTAHNDGECDQNCPHCDDEIDAHAHDECSDSCKFCAEECDDEDE